MSTQKEIVINGKKHIPAYIAFEGRKEKKEFFYDKIKSGDLHCEKIGNSFWVDIEEFEEWCKLNGFSKKEKEKPYGKKEWISVLTEGSDGDFREVLIKKSAITSICEREKGFLRITTGDCFSYINIKATKEELLKCLFDGSDCVETIGVEK